MNKLMHNASCRQKAVWLKAQTVPVGDCWNWSGGCHGVGYGCVPAKLHASRYAHRAMYELAVGPIPKGYYVLHTCDNRLCINPAHLWAGTHLENIKDMQAKQRHSGGSMPNESNPWCKFSDEQIAAIRKARALGIGKRQIERDFGISETHFYRVVSGISRQVAQ